MEAFGFQVLTVDDGNDTSAVGAAIEAAKQDKSRPSFIKIKTTIGYGVPDRAGTAKSHGEPIGEANIPILRESLGWLYDEPFFVPEDVYAEYKGYADSGDEKAEAWKKLYAAYKAAYPEDAASFEAQLSGKVPDGLFDEAYFTFERKADASRSISGKVLNELAPKLPGLFGGSADLGPSNKTVMKDTGYFSRADRLGRNVHFGVREIGMTAIGNGLALHGGIIPYVATFFVFSDYMKPMLRLSALMGIRLISVLTHDSIGVGEDGPTHEPVEQLAMLRATPNINVIRPADEYETRVAWKLALTTEQTPTVLVLSRQNLAVLESSGPEAEKGAYIVYDASSASGNLPDAIILSSGSEVAVSIEAAKALTAEGKNVRVLSVPSIDIFEQQDEAYKESILPAAVTKRIAVEAGSSFSWGKLVGPAGAYITMDRFGASSPPAKLFEYFGFTAENIAKVTKEIIG
jgi:transketolase